MKTKIFTGETKEILIRKWNVLAAKIVLTLISLDKEKGRMVNLELKSIDEKFKKCLIEKFNDELGGVHYIFRFPNNYGASVVKGKYTYGGDKDLWEIALIYFHDESNGYELTYEKDFEDDTIGYLSDSEVNEMLNKIIKF